MVDRVQELLAFDQDLMERILDGRPIDEACVAADLSELQGAGRAIGFVGFDEAGRGALAGPVAVACVQIGLERPASRHSEELAQLLAGLDDSKRLSPRRRESLHHAILSVADWGFGCASAAEIDQLGITAACRLAAARAFTRRVGTTDVALFDRGLTIGAYDLPELSFTHGDARSLHIAAASILAKVGRDAIMARLDGRFPGYELAKHKGYGTPGHRGAIARLGLSGIHRRSFCTRIETAES